MRASLLLLGSILLAALLIPTATASETWGCEEYEVVVGDWRQGVFLSAEDGAVLVSAGGLYVFSDGLPVLSPHLFSVWLYDESNGVDGPQRSDEVCDDTDGGMNFDGDCGIFCF